MVERSNRIFLNTLCIFLVFATVLVFLLVQHGLEEVFGFFDFLSLQVVLSSLAMARIFSE